MKKILLFFLILDLYASKMDNNAKKLEQSEYEKKQISKKLEDLADEIISGEKKLNEINDKVNKTSIVTKQLQELVNAQNVELDNYKNKNEELVKSKDELSNKLVDIIARDFAYNVIVSNKFADSSDSVISTEVFRNLSDILNKELSQIAKDYDRTLEKIDYKQKKINEISTNITNYQKQSNELISLKKRQENLINKQKNDEKIYKKRLADIQKQQEEIRKTLEKLKIVDNKKQVENNKNNTNIKHSNVKHSSNLNYDVKVSNYSGKKTIAPLDDFRVKRYFGDYTDPLYKIKIFNENVVLSSNVNDAKVKVVLDGKVVFANDTQVLDKVVIVEHANGIHTIYAHLSKFSEFAKVGSIVKKGNVIGRVEKDLSFEVTQKNYHINPLDLISVK
ncbi:murein hydrolase activator EnvC family protein [Campylobacter sp. MG1]|uniref:murein hydrolase activator EnvC family protein n=1 Tax=Campylobacter sp. MG1 TaxID=2976332 RepID=UPI00226C6875|nr:peptidoglycan DD-metalloendopeptidase family protein [Campylobacter sp. MG1]